MPRREAVQDEGRTVIPGSSTVGQPAPFAPARARARGCTLVGIVLFAGCHHETPPDAGMLIERGTDLRTSLELIFPEYRGANVTAGRVALTRVICPYTPADVAAVRASAAQNGFTGEPLTRPPFTLTLEEKDSALTLIFSLPIAASDVGRIYASQASMSSESMAHWLPTLASPICSEAYDLTLEWEAVRPERAAFLSWQLVQGLMRRGWSASLPGEWTRDAGAASVPDDFALTLTFPQSEARLDFARHETHATLHYHLVTRVRR